METHMRSTEVPNRRTNHLKDFLKIIEKFFRKKYRKFSKSEPDPGRRRDLEKF
jgi:hypothetical protein